MSEKKEKKKIDRRSSSGAALILAVVVAVTAVVLAVYVLKTDPYNLELLCVLAFAIIIGVFFAVLMGVSNQKARYKELEERLEEAERSQKASYILDKKNFKSIEETLKHIMDSHDEGMSEIIMTQKSVGKVVVGKMNKAMDALRADLDGLADKVATNAVGQTDNTEILRAIDNLVKEQQRLESRIAALSGHMGGAPNVSQNVTVTAPADGSAPIITTTESAPVGAAAPTITPVAEEMPTADIMPEMPDYSMDDMAEPMPEEIPDIMAEPEMMESISETMAEPEMPEDISASEGLEPLPEDVEQLVEEASEELPMPDLVSESEPEPPISEPEPEPIPEPEPEPIPEPEPEPEITPVSDDPNHIMTPEEIAAMVAGANAEPDPEPIPEPEPAPASAEEDEAKMPDLETLPDSVADILGGVEEIEEDPALEEEKPEMPDLSDPNRALSPEEIAALFANM